MSTIPEYVRSFKDCFGPIGCLKGTHHIVTSADVQPVGHPPRRIPISLVQWDSKNDQIEYHCNSSWTTGVG